MFGGNTSVVASLEGFLCRLTVTHSDWSSLRLDPPCDAARLDRTHLPPSRAPFTDVLKTPTRFALRDPRHLEIAIFPTLPHNSPLVQSDMVPTADPAPRETGSSVTSAAVCTALQPPLPSPPSRSIRTIPLLKKVPQEKRVKRH